MRQKAWNQESKYRRDELRKRIANANDMPITLLYREAALTFPSSSPCEHSFEHPAADWEWMHSFLGELGFTAEHLKENIPESEKCHPPILIKRR